MTRQPINSMQLARAKVNLCLHITGRRPDGFHMLDSIVVFPEIGDILSVQPANLLSLKIDGPFANGLSYENNSVIQAANLLADGRGAALHLVKNLPIASGIGGGSSDAAAALHLLAAHWNTALPLPTEILRLGADVPVCMSENPQRMRGIGERLDQIAPLPAFAIVLVNSGTEVSTAAIFKALSYTENPGIDKFDKFNTAKDLFDFVATQRNDMQEAAVQILPEITRVLAAISAQTDCQMSRMSGSGGTCFGLFYTIKDAEQAALKIAQENPDWWVKSAKV